jgi:hypothetical protein
LSGSLREPGRQLSAITLVDDPIAAVHLRIDTGVRQAQYEESLTGKLMADSYQPKKSDPRKNPGAVPF